MTSESDVKRQMIKSMTDHGGYGRRMEDQYAVGLYDTILIPHGLPVFFAEVKIVRGAMFGPTPRQYVELGRIHRVAGNAGHAIPVVIGWKDDIFYFSKPNPSIRCQDCFSVTTSTMTFHDQLVQYYNSQRK